MSHVELVSLTFLVRKEQVRISGVKPAGAMTLTKFVKRGFNLCFQGSHGKNDAYQQNREGHNRSYGKKSGDESVIFEDRVQGDMGFLLLKRFCCLSLNIKCIISWFSIRALLC